MGVEGNLRLHLRPLPKEDVWSQRVPALDQRGKGFCFNCHNFSGGGNNSPEIGNNADNRLFVSVSKKLTDILWFQLLYCFSLPCVTVN